MNDISDFIATLRARRIKIWVEEGELCYEAPRGHLTPDLLEEMRARKAEMVDFIRSMMQVSGCS